MMTSFHLLRPYMLLALIPLGLLMWRLLNVNLSRNAWKHVCDSHLLAYLPYFTHKKTINTTAWLIFSLLVFLILSLSGPSVYQQPVPTYHQQQARIVLLDVSSDMLAADLSPNRLQRAKFKLHDLFKTKNNGQFALIAYTSEAFVVSPLTDDAQTINALIPTLSPHIMPVNGNQLESALNAAEQLIKQSNILSADILVLTATPPTQAANNLASVLAKQGNDLSIIPTLSDSPSLAFQQFADLGKGKMLPFSNTTSDLDTWLTFTELHQQLIRDANQTAPIWRDDGRWLLLPAILILLALFQRNRLEGIRT